MEKIIIKAIVTAIAKREVFSKNNSGKYNWVGGNEYVPTPRTDWRLKNDLSNIGEVIASSLIWPSVHVWPDVWNSCLSDWAKTDNYSEFSRIMKPGEKLSPYDGEQQRFYLNKITEERVFALLPKELIKELEYCLNKR